jgi:hypothetical protein
MEPVGYDYLGSDLGQDTRPGKSAWGCHAVGRQGSQWGCDSSWAIAIGDPDTTADDEIASNRSATGGIGRALLDRGNPGMGTG